MEEGNLPTEVAEEPVEKARLSQGNDDLCSPSMASINQRKGITFAEATQSSENCSQKTYKDFVSQPAPNLSHRQRLLWLQERRTPGLWVQCDDCDKWRFLPDVLDAQELPAKWRCRMNRDKSAADCSVPEAPLRLREEEDLIHGEYSAGSLVLARLAGWPWWPAMVDDCPDTEQFYWLDGFSDIPTHYNVVFFDALDVTRAWIAPQNLKPYTPNKKMVRLTNEKKYKTRLEIAVAQANDAEKLSVEKRLKKYSFIARYTGSINQPKKVSKQELEKFQKKLKRMFDIEFPEEDHDEQPIDVEATTTVIRKSDNILLVGTPKSKTKKEKKRKLNFQEEIIKHDNLKDARSQETFADTEIEEKHINDAIFKQPDSLVAQAGSNVTSTVVDVTFDNDTSATYVPGSEDENETVRETLVNDRKRAASPSSDDFEF